MTLRVLVYKGKADSSFTEEMQVTFFKNHAEENLKQQTELAKNIWSSLKAYGIIEENRNTSVKTFLGEV